MQQFDILEQKITYLPQYAEDLFIPDESIVNKESVDLTFAGNIGKAQKFGNYFESCQFDRKEYRFTQENSFSFCWRWYGIAKHESLSS